MAILNTILETWKNLCLNGNTVTIRETTPHVL